MVDWNIIFIVAWRQTLVIPKLREHMASVVTAMKLSTDYNDFIEKAWQVYIRATVKPCRLILFMGMIRA